MQRITLSLQKDLLAEVESYCELHNYTRSELIRHALRLLIFKEYEPISNRVPTQMVNRD